MPVDMMVLARCCPAAYAQQRSGPPSGQGAAARRAAGQRLTQQQQQHHTHAGSFALPCYQACRCSFPYAQHACAKRLLGAAAQQGSTVRELAAAFRHAHGARICLGVARSRSHTLSASSPARVGSPAGVPQGALPGLLTYKQRKWICDAQAVCCLRQALLPDMTANQAVNVTCLMPASEQVVVSSFGCARQGRGFGRQVLGVKQHIYVCAGLWTAARICMCLGKDSTAQTA